MATPAAEPGGALLDAAAPALAAVDAWWGQALPPAGRLAVWGVVGAAGSLLVYRALLPRGRLRAARADTLRARAALGGYDGDLAGALPLMRRHIGAALRVVLAVLPAAAVAVAPVLLLTVWLDAAYGGGRYLPLAPAWAASWESPFFAAFVAATLALRRVMGVE